MKIAYIKKYFKNSSKLIIKQADDIIEEYAADGYSLTLRQLYYQFVSKDLFANNMDNYRKLGYVINDARLAGLISWRAIEDRTRFLRGNTVWDEPAEALNSCADSYLEDTWIDQKYRPEVWIEKDALIGVIERVCTRLNIDYFSCRGFNSQSEMWRAAMRIDQRHDQTTVILHMGDHDPSGIDMSRDIEDRLKIFGVGEKFKFRRIALNWGQVTKYKPPPNPAKTTDSRFKKYKKEFGTKSWELDALSPKVMVGMVEREVAKLREENKYKKAVKLQEDNKEIIEDLIRQL